MQKETSNKKSNFVHLHTHTHYSLLDGLSKIPELLDKAKELGMNALAITDHGVMYGVIEFYKEAKKRNIKPIIGCELYIAPRSYLDKTPKIDSENYHLVLLAKNKKGYKNLLKLVSTSHLDGYYYKPRVDKELLRKYNGGLIALSACLHGEIPRAILSGNIKKAERIAEEYRNIFGKDNFYLELQHHPEIEDQKKVNTALIEISKKVGIPLVATKDSHYLDFEDSEAQEVLLCLQTGKILGDSKRMEIEGDLSFVDEKVMREYFADVPEAIDNTIKIADQCNLEIDMGKLYLPYFSVPEGYTAESYLEKLCYIGLLQKFSKENQPFFSKFSKEGDFDKISSQDLERRVLREINPEIIKRLRYELDTIKKSGFAGYFLIVADFVNWAKRNKILVGPGRGSAAGSLVSYVLNITNINPLKYGLLFERFLNPDRISAPDIDMDFADHRRSEVLEYVINKYGKDHVAQIITFGTMAARMAVRDTGRVLGLTYNEVDQVAKLIPMFMSLEDALENVAELKDLYNKDEKIKKMLDLTLKLEGVARHASTHAAGVVISRDPLTDYVPLQRATKGETSIITQYSMNYLEDVGLLKMDFLGLANLTIMENAIRIIKKVYSIDINLDNLSLDDQETYKTLQRGETTGIFQLESEGLKRYLKELRPTVFEDIVAIVALYRPGPMEFIPEYIARKHGKKPITYIHPKLEPILKNTQGICIYQEQLMQIAQELAGFTLSEADVLRKAVGKKIEKLLVEQRDKFIKGCINNEISSKIAEELWQWILPFARYGFNKSHSVCYAMIAYQTAYLKTHYPEAFMAALMTSDKHNLDRIAKEIEECRAMGIEVAPPDINESFMDFAIVPGEKKIRYALSAIKNVGEGPIEIIEEERKKNGKFTNLENFVKRTASDEINKKTLESLIKCGALDCLGKKRSQLLASLDQILSYVQNIKKDKNRGQIDIFGALGEEGEGFNKIDLVDIEEVEDKQKLDWERELLGVYVSSHPLNPYKNILSRFSYSINNIREGDEGKRLKISGIISKIKKIYTKTRDSMLFVTIEDLSGKIELLVFPKILERDPTFWQEGKIVLTEGRVSTKDGVPKILVDKYEEFNPLLINSYKESDTESNKQDKEILVIKLDREVNLHLFNCIKRIFYKHEGDKSVVLHLGGKNGDKKIRTSFKVRFDNYFKNDLRTVLGYEPEFSEIVGNQK